MTPSDASQAPACEIGNYRASMFVNLRAPVLRLLVIAVLLIRLTPIGGEAAEALIAITMHDDSHDQAPDAEHGCTTLVHHCSCHSVAGTIHETTLAMAPPQRVILADFVLTRPRVAPDLEMPLRPPAG